MSEAFKINSDGFEVRGAQEGGWLVARRRDASRDPGYYYEPFIAAFTTFGELLTWLSLQPRDDPRVTPPSNEEGGRDD